MSKYSCLDIIKTKAKNMVNAAAAITHAQALDSIAKKAKFSNYHELVKVIKATPHDPRLLMAAFGDSDFADVIHNYYGSFADSPYAAFEAAVEEELSGDIASTNAVGFTVEDLTVTETYYEDTKGVLDLKVNFLYQGEQLLDHALSGTSFYVDATVRLLWRNEKWLFKDEDFEITNVESNAGMDWYDESWFEEAENM